MVNELERSQEELAQLVQGKPEKAYLNIQELAEDMLSLNVQIQCMWKDIVSFFDATSRFLRTNPEKLTLEHLGGMLKCVREMGDAADQIHKMCESQQKPPSLRTVLEIMISVRSFIQAQHTGKTSFVAFGKQFIPTGKALPSPPPKSQPEDRAAYFQWLRSVGLGHIIYEEVAWQALSRELSKRLENSEGDTPWPDRFKVYVSPSVVIKDAINANAD